MNSMTLATVVLAAVTVLGTLGGLIALTFRIGRMVGKVDALILQEAADHARMASDIIRVMIAQDAHEAWHRGPGPGVGVSL